MKRLTLGMVLLLALAAPGFGAAAHAANSSGPTTADWAHNPRLDEAGDLVVKVLAGSLTNTSPSSSQGTPCQAERSSSGNVQVNCLGEDRASAQNTQSETSVSALGNKVVVGFNDSLVCCRPAINFTGYSVSIDGGKTFTDMGDLPYQPNAQPIGDPSVAHDAAGNFYFASLALGSDGIGTHSLVSFYEMPAGSNSFQLVSVPVDVGTDIHAFADKEYLAVGTDGNGQTHFYITWTYFSASPESPIMLTDSTDGIHWRTTQVSAASTSCAQGSNPVPGGSTVYVSWEEYAGCTSADTNSQEMATVDAATTTVQRITPFAPVQGSGDTIVACNNASDLREVIETAPGRDVRLFEMPSTTIDSHGTLYAVWNDRPQGVGGDDSNATRIFLSYSLDGNRTWSAPQQISGSLLHKTMNDRFQPWITVDGSGLHAMWYERVPGTTQDLIRTDKADLTLATGTAAPRSSGETAISSVAFPVVQTNPQQDPVISYCYMGDYNNIASNGTTRFVTWGDNRNVVTTSTGRTENQPDVFLQAY